MGTTGQFPWAVDVPRYRRGMVLDPMSGQETVGDWGSAVRAVIPECLLAPGTSQEFPNVELEVLSHYATLYVPLNADVTEFDRVLIDGAVWDVIGRRSNWDGGCVQGSTVPLKWVRDGDWPESKGDNNG